MNANESLEQKNSVGGGTSLNVPVIIYHEGNQEYLKVCIEHTKRYNKRVILLGNESNKSFTEEWYNAADYIERSRWQEFTESFENLSFYDDRFAEQIFKRLFVIDVFIKEQNIDKFALLDSDILIYVDFSKMPYINEYDCGCVTLKQKYEDMRWITNIGISFFSKEALSEFVDFCIWEYKCNKTELLKKWEWQQRTNTPGGVGEMPLAYLWTRKTSKKIINLAIPSENYGIFENAINAKTVYGDVEYKMNNFLGLKRIKYQSGVPYYIEKNTGKLQRVDGLHFSTSYKTYMKDYSFKEHIKLNKYFREFFIKVKRNLKKVVK